MATYFSVRKKNKIILHLKSKTVACGIVLPIEDLVRSRAMMFHLFIYNRKVDRIYFYFDPTGSISRRNNRLKRTANMSSVGIDLSRREKKVLYSGMEICKIWIFASREPSSVTEKDKR